MKKIFALSLIVLTVLASTASAEVIVGRHSMLNFTEKDLVALMQESLHREFYIGLDVTSIAIKYYDSLATMQMALDRGDIELMILPLNDTSSLCRTVRFEQQQRIRNKRP